MYFNGQMCQKTVEMVGNLNISSTKRREITLQNAEKSFEELRKLETDITLEEIDAWKKDGRR